MAATWTVEEAATKWCPASPRTYEGSGGGTTHTCLGLGCMLWLGDDVSGSCGLGGSDSGGGGGGGGSTVLAPCTYAELPAPGGVAAGTLGMCTDAPSNIFGGMLTTGGGTFCVPVYYDENDEVWRQG